jgi:hypothetical protein
LIHLRKIILLVFGVISTIVGWGMWKEPYLDFNILLLLLKNELFRLLSDPFAIFGLALMFLGIWTLFMVLLGPWNLPYSYDELLILGKDKK